MPVINHPYRYIQTIRLQRQKIVSIITQDGLSVVAPILVQETHIPFEIHKDIELDLAALKAYFSTAPKPSQYAKFRDIQLHFILSDEPLLKEIVLEAMANIGLNDETKRLS